jgi:putative transcriptional regulator
MTKKPSRLDEEIVEMAEAQHRLGIMDDATFGKITARHLGDVALSVSAPVSGDEVRELRERAHMSQAAFARHLNMSTGYVSQLERGTKLAKGPALVLFNIMRRKGVSVVLEDGAS